MASNDPPYDALDRRLHASLGQITRGMSPAALGLAFTDRAIQLLDATGWPRPPPWAFMVPDGPRRRFAGRRCDRRRLGQPEWDDWPACQVRDAWIAWAGATQDMFSNVAGIDRHHAELAGLAVREWLLLCSPANHPLLNPAVRARALETQGASLAQGAVN